MSIDSVAMIGVSSSTVRAIGYDVQEAALYVRFHNGRLYRYRLVPKGVYERFRASASKGSFLWVHIRGRFRYERLE
jgi:hypothetical protein